MINTRRSRSFDSGLCGVAGGMDAASFKGPNRDQIMLQNPLKKDAPTHYGKSFVKTVAGVILLSVFCFIQEIYGTTYTTNGSSSDVQAKINSSANGDIVTLPSGSFTWTSGVTATGKAVKIQGAGSGRIIGRSLTSNGVGTGAKIFTTQSGLSITAGQTIRIIRRVIQSDSGSNVRGTFMEGTVTSYIGTILIMNVTSTGGSGTYAAWLISTPPTTTISYTGASGQAFSLTPGTAGNLELSGMKFTSTHALPVYTVLVNNGTKTTLIHDCWFEHSIGGSVSIHFATNNAVVWNCSFESSFFQSELAMQFKWEDSTGVQSWLTADTIGTHDTTGTKNVYIEDCDFHCFLNAGDTDGNSRVVFRYNVYNNAGTGSHGADTGPYGTRHWEYYNNTMIFEPTTNGVVLPLNWWFFIRGGTGVITDNTVPALVSQDWGTKSTVNMIVENIRRNAGPYPCWTTYPAPHSPGQGNDGSSGTLLAGDILDPIRIWNNTGTGGQTNIAVSQYEPDDCGNGKTAGQFTQVNRDYYVGSARPGYNKYTYPHPLRSNGSPPSAPADVHIVP